ncbi:cytochrome c, partial [Acinetobacter baumannii]
MYGVLGKMVKGDTPFDKAAADAALKALADDVAKIPDVFATNPKEDVANATFGSSQKIWQNKADFDAKVPPVTKAIADA